MTKIASQQRRGLSSVVGAVFMILVMVGALNVMLWTMQQQDKVTETIIEKSNSNLNKLNEDIDIASVRIDGDKLNMTVTNTGGAAATIKSIYVVNETANEQYRYDLDLVVDGRESLKDVGQTLPLIINDDTKYSIRLITESGNTVTTSLTPLSSVALPMSLYLIPPTFTPGENVTVLYTVTNNLTGSQLTGDVELKLHYSLDCTPLPGTCGIEQHVAPASNFTTIGKGNTALFKWVFEVQAPDETDLTFNASLANAREGNFVIEDARVKLIDSAQTSFSSEIIVSSNLVQKPEIFLMLPNPFGDTDKNDKGLWGVIIANPTEVEMTVSRIVINAYSSKPTSTPEMINAGCGINTVYPPSGWSCPHANMIEWRDLNTPEEIAGLEALSFLVQVEPDDLVDDEPAFMVSVAVFTNMGQFTKTGYSAGMSNSKMPLASVYMTDTWQESDVFDDAHILGNVSNIKPNMPIMLNVTIADLDTADDTWIEAGTKLIVNIPRGFTFNSIDSHVGFNQPDPIPYPDGSTQIVATLAGDVGDDDAKDARILAFTVTPPSTEPRAQRIYIMHTLLDGTADGGIFSVGAIGEFALQVDES